MTIHLYLPVAVPGPQRVIKTVFCVALLSSHVIGLAMTTVIVINGDEQKFVPFIGKSCRLLPGGTFVLSKASAVYDMDEVGL